MNLAKLKKIKKMNKGQLAALAKELEPGEEFMCEMEEKRKQKKKEKKKKKPRYSPVSSDDEDAAGKKAEEEEVNLAKLKKIKKMNINKEQLAAPAKELEPDEEFINTFCH